MLLLSAICTFVSLIGHTGSRRLYNNEPRHHLAVNLGRVLRSSAILEFGARLITLRFLLYGRPAQAFAHRRGEQPCYNNPM